MGPIPRLILHHEATAFLCRARTESDDEAKPLTGRTHIEMGSDDDNSASSSDASYSSDESMSSSDDSIEPALSLPAHIDIEAPAVGLDNDPPVSPLGVASPTSNGPLFYEQDEVHAFRRTRTAAETSVRGVETIAKITMKGAEKAARQTVKTTKNAAKQTTKTTRKVAKQTARTAKKTAKGTEKVVKQTANVAVGLPHELSSSIRDLALLALAQIAGPVILSMPTPLSMLHSVNAGLSQNRGFLYGTHTFMELFIISPFISTCHYAIPDAKIPVKARVIAVLVGLAVSKLVLAFIGEAWWSPHAETVFPIPFSFLVSAVSSLPFSQGALWLLTPKRNDPVEGDKIRRKIWLCIAMLLTYFLSLLVACLWAVEFKRLADKPVRQTAWVLFYQFLEFFFKIVVAANLTTRLNAQRWLQLNLVVDLIFASVHTAFLPYFASWKTVAVSVAGTMFTISWRSYAGVDRLQKFLPKAKDVVKSSSSPTAAFRGIGGLAAQMTTSPVKDIAPLSTRLMGKEGSIPEWDDDEDQEADDIEAQRIERSGTEETDSLSDSEGEDPSHESESSAGPTIIDRRQAFKNQKSQPIRNSILQEVTEEQRHLYHIVDSVSSAILITVVRSAAIMTSLLVRNISIASEHLNTSFQLSDDQWRNAMLFGFAFIGGVMSVIIGSGVYLSKGAKLGGLTLNRVITYMFRDAFWFFFFWFLVTQHLAMALQLNHFGADFTLKFRWITCREEGLMAWPECVAMEPSM